MIFCFPKMSFLLELHPKYCYCILCIINLVLYAIMYNYIVLAYYIFILLTWFMLRIDNIEIINLQLLFYCHCRLRPDQPLASPFLHFSGTPNFVGHSGKAGGRMSLLTQQSVLGCSICQILINAIFYWEQYKIKQIVSGCRIYTVECRCAQALQVARAGLLCMRIARLPFNQTRPRSL